MSEEPARADWRQSRSKRLKVAAASTLAKLVVRALAATLRVDAHPYGAVDRYRKSGVGIIFAVHHGPHFPVLVAYRGQSICVITSRSADGEILTRVLTSFGYTAARGSSSRGGMAAMKQLAAVLKAGGDVSVAVDGPRGPATQVKPGVILLAKRTGAAICPVGAAVTRCWQVNSWDRYRIPKPFARALVLADTPFTVPPDADGAAIEAHRAQLEQRLSAHQRMVDEAVHDRARARALAGEMT